jgi:hypothetical protein
MRLGRSNTSRLPSLLLFVLLLSESIPLQAQQPEPTVTYRQTFPGSEPPEYVISIAADCRATYQSDGKLTEESAADESFQFDFAVTQPNCAKIFELTKRAHYFEGELDSKKKNIASTGVKILSYKDPQRNTKATYNYSPIPEVQELTGIFQSVSSTMEFGRRLEYDHHYQKLALYQDLKRMDESAGRNGLQEISAITPILQKIVDDPSLMNVVRARAQRLLAGAK